MHRGGDTRDGFGGIAGTLCLIYGDFDGCLLPSVGFVDVDCGYYDCFDVVYCMYELVHVLVGLLLCFGLIVVVVSALVLLAIDVYDCSSFDFDCCQQ